MTHARELACGCCAGIYTAHAAIKLHAEAFESAGAQDKLDHFSRQFGPEFYGLPRNTDTITLAKERHMMPAKYDGNVTPQRANERLIWRPA